MKMKLADYIAPEGVLFDLDASSKTEALQLMSAGLSKPSGLPVDAILTALQKRENLGSTGVGQGIAIPHTRIDGIEKPIGLLARMRKPIDFESIDDLPVDIIFVLLTPNRDTNKHLNVLAAFSRKLRSPGALKQMRTAKDAQSLYTLFVSLP
ncbi:phosphotransferase IIA-like nitrogen-regulatory protein PtsN [Phyllobacterium brassicacearum]|nr:PTS sugar transporter subunit IIA [Phyllobacterium brassicacearum]TDQ29533.1 phosphotransferase IIA-like nitrogen-regulatory protein PtsN [Phyllobacterium brassicacearum]